MSGVNDLANEVWAHRLATDAFYRLRLGLPIEHLRSGSPQELDEDAAFAHRILGRLDAIPSDGLSADDVQTAGFLRFLMTSWVEAAEHHPLTFTLTPYASYFLSYVLQNVFATFTFDRHDEERYLSLAADYRTRVHELGVHLADQAQAGVRLPRPALPGARGSLERSKAAAQTLLVPAPERLEALGSGGASRLRDRIAKVSEEVTAAFDQVLTLLCDDYLAAAPAEVGQLQYDGGAANYARLIRLHTSSDRSAEEIHTIGLEQVAALAEQMASVRAQLGFTGAEAEFHAQLGADSRFYARTPQDVERTFMRHVAALEPHLGSLFSVLPQAPFGVARLAADLEPGMTYGYYQPPTPADPVGRYMYNGSSLDKRSLLTAGTLIFHELAPGHHFHLARQAENEALHPLRRQAVDFGAFNEGWAEYAAGLCHEVGLYADPYDHYGRLAHERFTAQRLVLDTGMNVLGWSLEQARGYMRANTIESDVQIATETLRYSTDLPGQALAYRLGYIEFESMRSKAKRAIGQRFDISQFNDTLLGPGALPFSVVADNVTTMITSHA